MKLESEKVIFDFFQKNTKTLAVGGHCSCDKIVLSLIFKFGIKFQTDAKIFVIVLLLHFSLLTHIYNGGVKYGVIFKSQG